MIDDETYKRESRFALTGLINDSMKELKNITTQGEFDSWMEAGPFTSLAENFAMMCRKMSHPDASAERVDILDRLPDIGDLKEKHKEVYLTIVRCEHGKIMFAHISGLYHPDVADHGSPPEWEPHYSDIITEVLLERGHTEDEIAKILPPEHRSPRVERQLNKQIREEIDAEVERFRSEINVGLDKLFEGGGESP